MLPFLAGAIVGATAVVAVNNNKKIKEKVIECASTVKDEVQKGASNVKQSAINVKDSVKAKVHDMTSAKEELAVQEAIEQKEDVNDDK
jgi:hypothetical protein